ncbi:hypothetical protein DSO57_1012137 [Entomophthora muscae]|uniref:Uncharacterized protein n=1 Tax=Entomophthora muscae TaxID=34485 RepID=A0ACC2T675_9FUNG|nr:hypothetical protein DSO57_1012137 [Entomophthora muscae]
MKFASIPLLVSFVAGSAKELGDLYNTYYDTYPDHTCAVFKTRPDLGRYEIGRNRVPSSWVWVPVCEWFRCRYTVCIPKSAKGEYITRRGDGGSENWVYNAIGFKRMDDEYLIVV